MSAASQQGAAHRHAADQERGALGRRFPSQGRSDRVSRRVGDPDRGCGRGPRVGDLGPPAAGAKEEEARYVCVCGGGVGGAGNPWAAQGGLTG